VKGKTFSAEQRGRIGSRHFASSSYEPKLVSVIKEFDLLYRIMSYRRDQKGHTVITIPYDANNQQNAIYLQTMHLPLRFWHPLQACRIAT
jgi:hypothetical protein